MLQLVGSDTSERFRTSLRESSSSAPTPDFHIEALRSAYDLVLPHVGWETGVILPRVIETMTTMRDAVLTGVALQMTGTPHLPPEIERTPGVCGGAARIAGTRIPVWTVERFRQLGATTADLLFFFPAMSAAQLGRALQYAADHPDEIAAQILQNEAP